jgi:NAD(P)-dependent dehydrogenase (short-subunit alcohol dehydrogenase family)
MSLKEKTIFVTGASRGIGLAIALRAARESANVVVAGYSGQDPFARRNPGLKIETWATHLKFGGCSLIFDRA